MSGLHLWMQGWSNEGERILTSVEKLDKFDNNTIAVNCSDEEFRSIGASLYQVLQWTTAHETMRIVQQPKGQKGFEAWHAIMRSSDQREHVRLEFSIRSADQ